MPAPCGHKDAGEPLAGLIVGFTSGRAFLRASTRTVTISPGRPNPVVVSVVGRLDRFAYTQTRHRRLLPAPGERGMTSRRVVVTKTRGPSGGFLGRADV
ncbi:hypothetical protein [Streptosporangium sp. NPDC002721]|uniref:hypothetical protein n=1 Tax=Streptosporangium sp. NPDC002721 TaxID=3366188 RepID=UPI0036B21204